MSTSVTLRRQLLVVAVLLVAAQAFSQRGASGTEPVVGGPCEGCEFVFFGLPAKLSSSARIAPATEPGHPLVLTGIVRTLRGKPAAGIVVYAYHTNVRGIYPAGATHHGALRGWSVTDSEGSYRFETIRPAAYPTHTEPEHIHMHVIEPQKGTYYIEDVWFSDDRLVTAAHKKSPLPRGGPGITTPEKDARGVWQVRRDIFLGKNIPGYAP